MAQESSDLEIILGVRRELELKASEIEQRQNGRLAQLRSNEMHR